MKKIGAFFAVCAVLSAAGAYDSFSAAFAAGNAARGKKDYATAAKCFAEARKLAGNNAAVSDALFYEGLVLADGGKVDAGIAKIREAIKYSQSPARSVTLQYHIGYYLQKNKRVDEAVVELKKARSFDPKAPMADTSDLYAAGLLVGARKYAEAEKLLQSVADAPATPAGKISALGDLLRLYYTMQKDPAPVAARLEKAGVQTGQAEVTRCERLWDYYLRTHQVDKALAQAKLLADNVTLTGVQRDHGTYYLARTYQYYKNDKVKAAECWKQLVNSKNAYLANQAKAHLAKAAK